ncbi:MAG TPA: tRNA (adenosine(37)-N6)-threonylcarbamoyltransferase complex ATPase subunit type 1 TsaE [Candidatus Eisenbacteria bacterium]|jgi:tRNA threonylcarbamoyladenosine biosynthesis protein TsaE
MTEPVFRVARSESDTRRLGEVLAPQLEVGDVVSLSGPLGAGKTCFVQGLAGGLGCRARVRSPSFSLVNEYHGRVLLVHLDLYRILPGGVESLGIEDYVARGALVVEWGEKLPVAWRVDALSLRFEIVAERGRRIAAEARAGRGLELLGAWRVHAEQATPQTAEGP